MEVNPPTTPSEVRFQRTLPMQIAAPVFLLVAVAVIGLVAPNRWNWHYLVWGIGIGLLGAANQEMMFHLAPKLLAATSEQANQLARRGRVRRNVNMLGSMAIGLSTGGLSAIFNKVVFVLFGTVVIALASITPYLLLPMMLSRARKRGAG